MGSRSYPNQRQECKRTVGLCAKPEGGEMISKKLWKNLGDTIAESARMTGEFNRRVRDIYPHGYTIDLSSSSEDYSEHFVGRVLDILAEEYGDTAVMKWWVYTDTPFHVILDDASEVVLTTAEEVAEFVLSLSKE